MPQKTPWARLSGVSSPSVNGLKEKEQGKELFDWRQVQTK